MSRQESARSQEMDKIQKDIDKLLDELDESIERDAEEKQLSKEPPAA